ncbi:MAG TPA: hypothetical protein VIN61_04995 [Gammaproteobacteria bacterium]
MSDDAIDLDRTGAGLQRLVCVREKRGTVLCPGRCACIDIPGDPEPHRFLSAEPLPGGASLAAAREQRLAWSTKVDFCARNLPLTSLAAFLDRAFPGQVFLPGGKVHSSVTAEHDGVTLAELAAACGLVTTASG